MRYDLVIIGSGAGLMVLEAAVKHGLNCAIVENSKFGGTCLTKGCIPSKMLVYPADLIRDIESADRIGVKAGHPQVDWATVSRRMWEQIDYHKEIENFLQVVPNLTVYKGTASFTGSDSAIVSYGDGKPDDVIHAEKFVIAAGARSLVPAFAGLEETGYITSETFFGAKFPKNPWKSLALIGGGTITAEFAHIFSSFGTKVTIIGRSGRILRKEEPEISEFITKQFVKDGVNVLTDSSIERVFREGNRKHIVTENRITKEKATIECEEILVASGVRSNGDSLALEKAGVETDKNGWIITNPYLETSQKNIWALGDINGKYQFRHKANHEAEVLSHNLFNGTEKKKANYEAVPWAIFTHPQIARLGRTEQELLDAGVKYRTEKNYYSEVAGGRAMGYRGGADDDGFVKMIVGEDRKILGVHIVGPQAAVLLQPFVHLMNAGSRCKEKLQDSHNTKESERLKALCPTLGTFAPVSDAMVIHPSLSELTAWVFEKFDFGN